ncbi:rRNA adenine N-6-methyltransferase family protein, partial [Bacteroides thetaiotaomicron]|uniref:rRNA adenine N-6-methyltransferase family protein n=1 Tax=Bacteroides thetaiotaomicron TaxID=818 RepID=UPI0039B474E5
DTSRQTKNLNKLLIRILLHLQVEFSTALKSIFRKSQVRSISEKFGLNLNAQIVCLSPSQWVNCFLEMLEVVPEKFHPS